MQAASVMLTQGLLTYMAWVRAPAPRKGAKCRRAFAGVTQRVFKADAQPGSSKLECGSEFRLQGAEPRALGPQLEYPQDASMQQPEGTPGVELAA